MKTTTQVYTVTTWQTGQKKWEGETTHFATEAEAKTFIAAARQQGLKAQYSVGLA